jgi:hypothetical protein
MRCRYCLCAVFLERNLGASFFSVSSCAGTPDFGQMANKLEQAARGTGPSGLGLSESFAYSGHPFEVEAGQWLARGARPRNLQRQKSVTCANCRLFACSNFLNGN